MSQNSKDVTIAVVMIGLLITLAILFFSDASKEWKLIYRGSDGEAVEGATYDTEEACQVARTNARTDGYTPKCVAQ